MKKLAIIAVCMSFLLSACSGVADRILGRNNKTHGEELYLVDPTDEIFQNTIDTLFDKIGSKDRNAVKSMFAHNAIGQDDAFEADLDVMLDFVKGEIISVEERGSSGKTSFEQDYVKTSKQGWYVIRTDTDSYIFVVIACLEDTTDPNNIGIQTLRVLREADKEIYFASWDDVKIPGIYVGQPG